jgi:hypothetical protein
MQEQQLPSERLNAGQRTYFFDIKQTPSGDKYLNITETRLGKDGERERRDIRVFEDHIKEFSDVFKNIAGMLENQQ